MIERLCVNIAKLSLLKMKVFKDFVHVNVQEDLTLESLQKHLE
jgi:hypothetical protein